MQDRESKADQAPYENEAAQNGKDVERSDRELNPENTFASRGMDIIVISQFERSWFDV